MLGKKLQLKMLMLLLASSLTAQDLLAIDIGAAIDQATAYMSQASSSWLSAIDNREIEAAMSLMIMVLVFAIYSMFKKFNEESSINEKVNYVIEEINQAKTTRDRSQYELLKKMKKELKQILEELELYDQIKRLSQAFNEYKQAIQ